MAWGTNVPVVLKPDPSSARQLSTDGPMAIWRDGTNGREGLVLSVQACGNAKCSCRDVAIEGWAVGEQLIGVSFNGLAIRFSFDGRPRTEERRVLAVSVDVDTGAVTHDAKRSESWAVEWFRKECDPELLESLRGQFDAAKRHASAPFDWRTADWSGWEPGRDVSWLDLHGDDESSDVVVDGQTYVLGDCYCVEPGCTCEEVRVIAWREDDAGDLLAVGDVTVMPMMLAGAQFHAHGAQRPLLQRIWKAWCNDHPALLLTRQAAVRKLAPEFQALMAKRRVAKTKEVGPNKPCPCGSGKKFKKCHMGA